MCIPLSRDVSNIFFSFIQCVKGDKTRNAARRIFNSLLGVSSGDETLHLMFDILREKLLVNVEVSH